ncbi:hypothetical protein PUR61_10470 [Streptomyces sp. BE20]|uniref:hypothetical protein n=1 Tax=Streptomyces sp. BE20 TaxID=3002525 RepID=UPI002E79BD62|nr:hypothetical protein [Streptomyces sp. BE20]MEE1822611.1 hypothetical protein [Streptomyces sp. BE20]
MGTARRSTEPHGTEPRRTARTDGERLDAARRTGLQLLLLLVYLLVFTPVGLVARLVRDPLDRAVDRTAASYWITS